MGWLQNRLLLFSLVLCLCFPAISQQAPPAQLSLQKVSANSQPRYGPAATLYEQLRSVGLDPSRVYRARNVSVDRADIHISLDDGVIGFTQDVAGKVTGAFFEGDGEILLTPPNQVERASMALFTGAAILEERFVTAYFRWNDDTFSELQSQLAAADHGAEFVTQWNDTAHSLAEVDALRLLITFSRFLPEEGPAPAGKVAGFDSHDRLLHGRMQGRDLGVFDIYYDSTAAEQIWAGQSKIVGGVTYYNVWTSFAVPAAGTEATAGQAKPDPIKISNYRIESELKPPTELSAEAWLQADVLSGGQRTALFELSRFLQIDRIESDGVPLEFIHNQAIEGTDLARRGNDLVAVVFPRALETGQKLELYFTYRGDVLSPAGDGLLHVGERGTWYPNRGVAMSRFDLRFRYPSEWTLVATGALVQDKSAAQSLAPGLQSTHWISEIPIPLAGFNLGKYQRTSVQAGGIPVNVYATQGVERNFPETHGQEAFVIPPSGGASRAASVMPSTSLPPSPARNEHSVATDASQALEAYSAWFGAYPYSSLSLTQIPGNLSQGWPGLIFLSSFSFLTREEQANLHLNTADEVIIRQVIAHEVAHQWWGDLVTWRGYRDQWVAEGLANYSSLMLLQAKNPQKFQEVMKKYRDDLLQKNQQGHPLMEAGPVTLGERLSSAEFPNGYETISYERGTWLFHMLRCAMRDAQTQPVAGRKTFLPTSIEDEPFIRALRKLREQYSGKAIDTADMLRVFEEELPRGAWYEGKRSLNWFFENWVNGTAVPKFKLQEVQFSDRGGATVVSGTIAQQDAPDGMVSFVPLYAVTGGKLKLMGRVFLDGPRSRFRLNAPPGTRKIVLDPEKTLLSRD